MGYALQPAPRAARPAAGDRSLRTVPSAPTPVPRHRLSRRLRVQGETQATPTTPPYQIAALAPYGPWASDLRRRLLRDHTALSPVSFAPGAGQYTVTTASTAFSAADAASAVTIGYGYVPQDIAQAATSSRPSVSEPPSASASGRSPSAAWRQFPTTSARYRRRSSRCSSRTSSSRSMFALDLAASTPRSPGWTACLQRSAAALAAKAAEAAAALADRVRTDKLSGGVLNARSGALRDSIVADVSVEAAGVRATVGSSGDVKYADPGVGGQTAAHESCGSKRRLSPSWLRRVALRSENPAFRLGHSQAALSAFRARRDEGRDRHNARRRRGRKLERA